MPARVCRRCVPGALGLLAALLILGRHTPAEAVTFSASLDPIRLQMQPGQVQSAQVRLTLSRGEPRTQFKVLVEDWWRSEDGIQSFYAAPGTLRSSCGSWVTVNPAESAVGGGETLNVRVTVAVAPDAPAGGYWCALTINEAADPRAVTPEGVGVRFLASLSTGIYVSVGAVTRDAAITAVDFATDRVVVAIRNVGTAPVPVEGRIEFRHPGGGETIVTVSLPRGVLLLDPIPVLRLAATLPETDLLPSGHYVVRIVLDIGLDHYLGAEREVELLRATALAQKAP